MVGPFLPDKTVDIISGTHCTIHTGAEANAARHLGKGERKRRRRIRILFLLSVVVDVGCDRDALDLVMFELMVS